MVSDLIVAGVLLAAVVVLLSYCAHRRPPPGVEPVPRRSRDRIDHDGRIR